MSDSEKNPVVEEFEEESGGKWTTIESKKPVRRQKKSKYQDKNTAKYQPKSQSKKSEQPAQKDDGKDLEQPKETNKKTNDKNNDKTNKKPNEKTNEKPNEKTNDKPNEKKENTQVRTRQPNQYYRRNDNRRDDNRRDDERQDNRPSRFAKSTPESEEDQRQREERDKEKQEYREAITEAENLVIDELMLNRDFLEDKLADCEYMINPRTGSGYNDYRLTTDNARRIKNRLDDKVELDDKIMVNGRSFSRSHFYSNRNFRTALQDRYWTKYHIEVYLIKNIRRDRDGKEFTVYMLKFPVR